MEFDFEKLFKWLATENSLFVLGVGSTLISMHNQYTLGIKLGVLFVIFGAIFRFYRINIVSGLLEKYKHKPKYKTKTLQRSEGKKDSVKLPRTVPLSESWYLELIDFCLCLIILTTFVYLFLSVVYGLI